MAAEVLKGSGVFVNPVTCFPLGYDTTETKQTIDKSAEEIDMVLNLGALFGGDYQYVQVKAAQGVRRLQANLTYHV